DHRRRLRRRGDRRQADPTGEHLRGAARRRPLDPAGRGAELLPLHVLRAEHRSGAPDPCEVPLGGGRGGRDHDRPRRAAEGRRGGRRDPLPRARRGLARPVRLGGAGGHPDPVEGGPHRQPQPGHRRHPAGPGGAGELPSPVLGGASLALFASVALVGIQTLSKVDLTDNRNSVIVGTSLGLAMLVSFKPDIAGVFPAWAQVFVSSGVTVGAITAIVLNLVFFHIGRQSGAHVATTADGERIGIAEVDEMDRETFVATFGSLFNGATWPLERAWEARPFADAASLRAAIEEAVLTAERSEQDAL